jgi:ABC-type antimicrobial peptide transport system permease subunit
LTWRDAAVLAARSVRRRPGRTGLTILAVALASALLTALLTISGTAETRVLDELAKGGPLAGIRVAAAEPDPGQIDRDDARPGPDKLLDDAALNRMRNLSLVRTVVPVVSARLFVTEPQRRADGDPLRPFTSRAVGVDLRRAPSLPLSVVTGRLPGVDSTDEVAVTPGWLERLHLTRTQAPRVIGSEVQVAAGRLFDEGNNQEVRGRWVRLRVVGVVAQEAGDGEMLLPLKQVRAARAWTLAGVGQSRRLGVDPSPYNGAFVVAQGIDNVSRVRAQITAIGYSTSAPENLIASVRRYLRVVEIVLTAIGAIALVIAAIGIANALLAAVRERKREIGVLKAIGARDRDVLRVFLLEAGVVGFVGGVLGTAVGWGIARVVGQTVNHYLVGQGLVGVQLVLPLPIIAGGIIGSAVLALIAGTIPAWRAARLPAREAVGS